MLNLLETIISFAARYAIGIPLAYQNIISYQIQFGYFPLHRIEFHQNGCEIICEHHETVLG
jgi:hypothetical protein